MNVKVFQIRLSSEHIQHDQENLNKFFDTVPVEKTEVQIVVNGNLTYWSILVFYKTRVDSRLINGKSKKIFFSSESILTETEKNAHEALTEWRSKKAKELKIPEFRVCRNAELITISKIAPQTIDDLIKIKGFASTKIAKFGNDIIEILNSFQYA